jgi:hypothetical protein
VVNLDDEDDLGFVVDVIAEGSFVVFIVFVNWVSGLDFLACTGFKGLNKPFLMLLLPDVENTSIEILSVTSANRFESNGHFFKILRSFFVFKGKIVELSADLSDFVLFLFDGFFMLSLILFDSLLKILNLCLRFVDLRLFINELISELLNLRIFSFQFLSNVMDLDFRFFLKLFELLFEFLRVLSQIVITPGQHFVGTLIIIDCFDLRFDFRLELTNLFL